MPDDGPDLGGDGSDGESNSGTMVVNKTASSTTSSQWMEHLKKQAAAAAATTTSTPKPEQQQQSPQPRPYADWPTEKLKKAIMDLDEQKEKAVHAIVERYTKYRQAVARVIEEKKRSAGATTTAKQSPPPPK
jgi:hypothetical protein